MDIEVTVRNEAGEVEFRELVTEVPREALLLPDYSTMGLIPVAEALTKRATGQTWVVGSSARVG